MESSSGVESESGKPVLPTRESLTLLDLSVSPIWIFDINQHVIWWANIAAVRFWHADSREDLLQRDYSTDSGTARRRLRQFYDNSVSGKPTNDTWTLYPDGDPISVPVSLTPVQIDSDRRKAVLIEVTTFDQVDADATDWRLVEATRYTPTMISFFTMNGKLISMNPAAVEAFGKDGSGPDAETKTQLSFQSRFINRIVPEKLLRQAADGRETSGEFQTITTKGEKWHRVDIRLGRDPVTGDACLIVIEEDISSLKQAVFDLEELNATLERKVSTRTSALELAIMRAEEANRAKSDFLARMSHDLRTPLNAILGFSDILASPGTQSLAETRFKEYGIDINAAAGNLLALVNDLLDLSRIEAGRFPVHVEMMDLCTLFNDASILFRSYLEKNQLTLELDNSESVCVVSDRRALSQIITNLMTNAVKYNRTGGSVTVSIKEPEFSDSVIITIADTGPGIPDSELKDIFEPYIRGRAEIASDSEGTGLGLPICKQIAILLHIDIDIQSVLGEGTTVSLTVPRKFEAVPTHG